MIRRHFVLLAPEVPIGRAWYAVAQFLLMILARLLLYPIHELAYRGPSVEPIVGVFVATVAVFGMMYILAVKRLLDVGWSRRWALLISGPVLIYLLLALRPLSRSFFTWAILPVGLLFLAFVGLILLLFGVPSKKESEVLE